MLGLEMGSFFYKGGGRSRKDLPDHGWDGPSKTTDKDISFEPRNH